jgi:hypothetical protein
MYFLEQQDLKGITSDELCLVDLKEAIDSILNNTGMDNLGEVQFSRITNMIHANFDIFYRFNSSPHYITLLQDSVIKIIKIMYLLKKYNCTTFLFFTSIPHHLNSRLFEIACELMEIPQVSLYNIGYLNRLLPLVKGRSLTDRRVLGANISNFVLKDSDLSKLLFREVTFRDWLAKLFNSSVLCSILTLTLFHLQKLINLLSTKIFVDKSGFKFYFSTDLILIWTQKSGIRFLNKNILPTYRYSDLLVKRHVPHAPIIFYAHFQPEATTYIEGGIYKNHVALILELRSRGFKGEILYKEHPGNLQYSISGQPTRVGLYRDKLYYKNLLDLGCIFLNHQQSIHLMSKLKNYTVLTTTGTIALEFALKGSKVVVAGNAWFNFLPNIVPFDEFTKNFKLNSGLIDSALKLSCERNLLNFLNNSTMGNIFGIGTNIKSSSKNSFDEFKNLVKFLESY